MVDALQDEMNRLNSLRDKLAFKDANGAVDDIERTLNALPGMLAELRTGGYVYKGFFEHNLTTLTDQWRRQRPLVTNEIGNRQRALTSEMGSIQTLHAQHVPAGSSLANLESRVSDAERSLESMYKGLQNAVSEFEDKVKDALWTVNQIKNATFTLQGGEAAFEAVPANWKKPGDNDGVEGVLFLTDRRLIFEQREEVATKKVLFITTAKQKLQSVQWEVPVTAISAAAASKRGFMNKDDFLTITLSFGPFQTTDLHLRGESGEAWRNMIEQVRSGAVTQERVGQTAAGTAAASAAVNVHNWGLPMGVIVGAAEGPIRIRAAGKVRYSGTLDTTWLNSIIGQRVTDLVGAKFSGRPRSQVPALAHELLIPLKEALQPDFQAKGAFLQDVQIDLLDEVSM